MPRIRTYGLDIDTIRYAQRVKSGSGATILPEPLKQINKFVIGVKKLGLWNSMVCWPMRSIHNAGTGSTVYSLGGRGVFNGTLVNGIEWERNGILAYGINSTSKFLRLDFPISNRNFTFGFTTRHLQANTVTASEELGRSLPTQSTIGQVFRRTWNGAYYWDRWLQGANIFSVNQADVTLRSFYYSICLNIGIEAKLQINNAFTKNNSHNAIAGNETQISLNRNTSGLDGIYHFGFGFYQSLSDEQMLLVYDNYKRTLGIGLNLP